MNNHWQMNRMGFVNFWLYDEETFEFLDGKLLLRGQNGSGKSITTQSFIPFILDGDRTPSRLDPFGSSDRRMEYYFLGEEGKDEATGYLFLEFKKAETEEYRTIAIGQRARRGKPMDFWGFVILDGRRAGIDLTFYKETGSTKIPCDKQDMRKILGAEVPFTDVPGEYKAMVNKYLFGFMRPEQYEQFIKLLVKVRAPKLSKEFKPTKVYEILNESLQTLTDEDLRAMVDAMEKMDGIQESLEQLQRSFSDVKIIRNEYVRYNQYMLARKGQAYLNKKQEMEKAQKEFQEQEQQKQDLTREKLEKQKHREELEDQARLVTVKLTSLIDTDMEEADLKLEKAKTDKQEAAAQVKKMEERIEACKSNLFRLDREIVRLEGNLEQAGTDFAAKTEELCQLQEVLQWKEHSYAMERAGQRKSSEIAEIAGRIKAYKKQISEAKSSIEKYDVSKKEYDTILEQYELCKKEMLQAEQEYDAAQERVLASQDALINEFYQMSQENQEWIPDRALLMEAEKKLRAYKEPRDEEGIRDILRRDYEQNRKKLQDLLSESIHACKEQETALAEACKRFKQLQAQKEVEPERSEIIMESRRAMGEAGIDALPFYKAVEFAQELSQEECARLEMQLRMMGILDALVVPCHMVARVKEEFPQLMDTILCADKAGTSTFTKLKINEEIAPELQQAAALILSNIREKPQDGAEIYIGEQGDFKQGILYGKSLGVEEAAFVGTLARKRKREQMLQSLQEEIDILEQRVGQLQEEASQIKSHLDTLEEEYQSSPNFKELNERLDGAKKCELELQYREKQCKNQEKSLDAAEDWYKQLYQVVLHKCKGLPYGRTLAEYEEAENSMEEYQQVWQGVCECVGQLERLQLDIIREQENSQKEESQMEEAFQDKRTWTGKLESFAIEVRKYEEYLQREDVKEKAEQIRELKEKDAALKEEEERLKDRIIQIQTRLDMIYEQEGDKKEKLQEVISREAFLRKYFEEELALGLVMERGTQFLSQCAEQAVAILRESDRGREPQDVLNALYRVYQQHNSNLSKYGTALEDCFEGEEDSMQATRKRVRIASVWNGKKLYLEEFYEIIKSTIDETELLIQKKDRELFEDILSQTISQQLTDRIAESRKWVQDMSELMKGMDTSMGLTFSLSWKPKAAENDAELDTNDLEHILLRDRELLTTEDIERVARHFRSKIKTEKVKLVEEGGAINYMELVRDALDYRRWFTFQMSYKRSQEEKKLLSNAAFNRFSGGEKAMAMYVPLFAAVNAQYKKASKKDHPRMIALDEAFAGVDDKNISSMFQLVESLRFDYIMNSQALWGCYDTVKSLKIAELLRPLNSQIITVISYIWNGHERILNE